MEIKIRNIEDLPHAASELLKALGDRRVVAFHAPMGAGKTTLIAEMCRQLGATDDFGSPTFSIVNEYVAANGDSIYHFDFYRLESAQDAADIGAEDYFYSGCLCFIEWPENAGEILPADTVDVNITADEATGERTIKL